VPCRLGESESTASRRRTMPVTTRANPLTPEGLSEIRPAIDESDAASETVAPVMVNLDSVPREVLLTYMYDRGYLSRSERSVVETPPVVVKVL